LEGQSERGEGGDARKKHPESIEDLREQINKKYLEDRTLERHGSGDKNREEQPDAKGQVDDRKELDVQKSAIERETENSLELLRQSINEKYPMLENEALKSGNDIRTDDHESPDQDKIRNEPYPSRHHGQEITREEAEHSRHGNRETKQEVTPAEKEKHHDEPRESPLPSRENESKAIQFERVANQSDQGTEGKVTERIPSPDGIRRDERKVSVEDKLDSESPNSKNVEREKSLRQIDGSDQIGNLDKVVGEERRGVPELSDKSPELQSRSIDSSTVEGPQPHLITPPEVRNILVENNLER
jgi:hypothetical protein